MIELIKQVGPWVVAAISLIFGIGVTTGANKADGAKAEIAAHTGPVHKALDDRLANIQSEIKSAKEASEDSARESKLTRQMLDGARIVRPAGGPVRP